MGDKNTKKAFFEDTITIEHKCKKCEHVEEKTYVVKARKETIKAAVPAEVEIITEVDLQSTMNDFRENKEEKKQKTPDSAEDTGKTGKPPEEPKKEADKKEEGVIAGALGS